MLSRKPAESNPQRASASRPAVALVRSQPAEQRFQQGRDAAQLTPMGGGEASEGLLA